MRKDPYFPDGAAQRELIVIEQTYPAGSVFASHTHQRGQFAYAASGVMTVSTQAGNWVVPAGRAVWMPAGVTHAMTMSGPVTILNVFIRQDCAHRVGLTAQCKVVEVSPLLRCLLEEAKRVPLLYASTGREGCLMTLLSHELANMPTLPLNAPLPDHPRLMQICLDLVAAPSIQADLDAMAAKALMSRKTFTRLFRKHTGLGFADWRQQACLLAAIAQLSEGRTITQVAMDLGYASTSAFTAAFRRVLGLPPSKYLLSRG